MGTAEDKPEIMELMARCDYVADRGDAAGFADLFTDDATGDFITVGRRRTKKGREELMRLIMEVEEKRRVVQFRHFIGCPMFMELTPERAVTRTYMNVCRTAREPGATVPPGVTGVYYDELVRTPKGWRFKSRKFIADPEAQP